ncbi:ATP-dependent DNA ligase [Streptomyces tateyamensis]|uniref:DNA ligase (ATP) n=1 Tax=Streptomyces tateyamensis TaxID=565073 RepID=A0A2V4NLE8_9ACTN|nr:ATP-dependent DNA ligase [Streptomyces tateyamensis]PYC75823.1 ATP-dependent DNA ligase [Streptomyces tateyamensis]
MDLPVLPPVEPMLAKAVTEIPDGLHYEAKWDGFRALVFRDGEAVEVASRTGKSLARYFPELLDAFRAELPERCVLDGEIVLAHDGRLHFEELQERIHPADSRVRRLATENPATFVAFDLLALGDRSLMEVPLAERRPALVAALAGAGPRVFTAPATRDRALAQEWFTAFEGAGLDGIVAKPLDQPYRPGVRAMFKIKHGRTADCVVAGYREHKDGQGVGSLLLGLYDDGGTLQHVGVCSSFTAARRKALTTELAPLRLADPAEHPWAAWTEEAAHEASRMPGAPSRWSGGKDAQWVALRPELVCEVAYDHMEGTRFRHTTRFQRWRPDRTARSCDYSQLEEPVGFDLNQLLARGVSPDR